MYSRFLSIGNENENNNTSNPSRLYLDGNQEARRAAERAYDVAKVDERVNRAVAAANRSANAARVAAVKAVQKEMQYKSNSDSLPIPIV